MKTLKAITNPTFATVTSVTSTFNELLSTVASNGTVTDVISFLQPPLSDIWGVDELWPGLIAACTASVLPCHFVDLASSWSSGDDTGGNVPVPTGAGATVITETIWATMQAHCIAQ